ncbi:MAG: Synaptonemal complex protein 1 [Marteilia pararefringens]
MRSSTNALTKQQNDFGVKAQENTEVSCQDPLRLKDKLSNQIDKIKQWKIGLEQEIGEKDMKLSEKEKNLSKTRTELKDLQFKLETLNLKLKEEFDNRNQIDKRIENTRNICLSMKDEVSRTSRISEEFKKSEESLKRLLTERVNEIELLTLKFEQLEKSSAETICTKNKNLESLKTEKFKLIESNESEKRDLEQKIESCEDKIKEGAEKLETMKGEVDRHFSHINELESEISISNQTNQDLNERINQAKDTLHKLELAIVGKNKGLTNAAALLQANRVALAELKEFFEFSRHGILDMQKSNLEFEQNLKGSLEIYFREFNKTNSE